MYCTVAILEQALTSEAGDRTTGTSAWKTRCRVSNSSETHRFHAAMDIREKPEVVEQWQRARLVCPAAVCFTYTVNGRKHDILLSFAVQGAEHMTGLHICGGYRRKSWSGWTPVGWQTVSPTPPSPFAPTEWTVHINWRGDMRALRRREIFATGRPKPVGGRMWDWWSEGWVWIDIKMVTLPMTVKQLASMAEDTGDEDGGTGDEDGGEDRGEDRGGAGREDRAEVIEVPVMKIEVPVTKIVEKIVRVEVPVQKIVKVFKVEVVEKIVEKIVEVPKIIQKIVEVPVEKIVKVPVPVVIQKIVEVPVVKAVEAPVVVEEIVGDPPVDGSWEILSDEM